MKVVIVETTIHESLIGGAQTFLPFLLEGIKKSGNQVFLLTKGEPEERVRMKILESGAELVIRNWGKPAFPESGAKEMAAWVNEMKPDVYLVSVSWDIGWLALPLIDPSVATLAIAHSNKNAFYEPVRHYKNFLTDVIGVSHEICRQFNSYSGMEKENVHWIPYGVRASDNVKRKEENEVLNMIFVGRIEEADKRISDVVKIALGLDAANVNFFLRIVGDGSKFEEVKRLLELLIVKGKVSLTGWVDGDTVLKYLRESHVFILTSSSEGFSISLIEAMANGCCPVVTDIPSGSVQLITNQKSGFLLPVGDVESFIDAISSLVKSSEYLNDIRCAAWNIGEAYSVEKMQQNYLNVFMASIAKNNSNPRVADISFPVMDSCRSRYPKWVRKIKAFITSNN